MKTDFLKKLKESKTKLQNLKKVVITSELEKIKGGTGGFNSCKQPCGAQN